MNFLKKRVVLWKGLHNISEAGKLMLTDTGDHDVKTERTGK